MSKISQCDNYPWDIDDQVYPDDRCRKRKHPINIVIADTEEINAKIEAIKSDVDNMALDKQDKLEAGKGITIDGNVISSNPLLDTDLQSEINLGGIVETDKFDEGTPVEDVLEKLLKKNDDSTILYVGATDRPAETVAELQPEEISAEVLTSKKIERTILSKYVPTTDEGQFPTIAVDKSIKLADWRNKATGISYLDDVEHIMTDKHNIYRFKHSVYNEEEGGEDEVFTFTKESN